jgi:hypothetical protein
MLKSAFTTMLLLASAAAATGQLPVAHVYDWETTITDDGAGSLTFRAMTLEETKQDEDTLVLSLDRLVDRCETVLISMAVVGQDIHGLPGGMLSPNFFGELQVDKQTPRRFDYRFLTDPHFDNVILVQLTRWDGSGDLINDLRKGSKLNFRFLVDGEEHAWRFSLMGVTSVLEQTYQQCLTRQQDNASQNPPLEEAALAEKYAM